MDNTIFSQIVAPAAVLLGVALTAYVHARMLKRTHTFQYASQQDQRMHEQREQRRAEALERLTNAHEGLSEIGRAFSVTNFDIVWRSQINDVEYDKQYLELCQKMDGLSAFSAIYEPSLIGPMESVSGQMNLFWGSFNEILRLSALGEKVDFRDSCFEKAHAAVGEINTKTIALRDYVARCAGKYADRPIQ